MSIYSAWIRGLVLCTLMFPLTTATATEANTTDQATDKALRQAIVYSQNLSVAPLLDRELISRNSKVYLVRLSPNGKTLVFLKKEGQGNTKLASLWLYKLKTKQFKKLFTFREISEIVWSSSSQSIFMAVPEGIAVSRLDANPSPYILKKLDPKLKEKWLDVEDSFPDSLVVQIWDRKQQQFIIQRVEVNGTTKELYRDENELRNFTTDFAGNASIAASRNRSKDTRGEKFIYDLSGANKKHIWTCQWDDNCRAFYFDKTNQRLLLRTNQNADLARMAWADLKTKRLHTIHSDPLAVADIEAVSLAVSPLDNTIKPLLFSYYGDRQLHYGASLDILQHIDNINNAVASDYLILKPPLTGDIGNSPWLIHDRSPLKRRSHFYLYHPKTATLNRPLEGFIAEADADINIIRDEYIAPSYAIHYKSSDGFNLQGYVTFPSGIDLTKAPLVVKVHGGPFSRVKNIYDSVTQLLANRGYIVFQPNFRASTGFGKAYQLGVLRDFGDGRIQQDIIDGTDYLLRQGLGDRKKLGIVGHSFGGFSVLGALAFTPELFQVGFAGAPPDDIGRSVRFYKRFIKKQRRELDEYFFKRVIVDWNNKTALAENTRKSPAANAHKINKPLVIWAGKNDDRVFAVDVKNYALRIEAMEKKVSLFVDPKAKHSPSSKIGFLAYQYLMEKVLADHLGGNLQKLEPKKDKQLIRYLKKNMLIDHNGVTPGLK